MSRIDELITELCLEGVTYKTFGEMGTITRGKRFVKSDIVESGTPCIHYGELYTKYGTWATQAFSYLDPKLASRLRAASPGDVIFVSAGETIEDIGKAVAWLGSEDVVTHDALYAFRSPLDPKYVAYFSQTVEFHNQIRRYISSAKISAISAENLAKVRIPIPPLEIQHEIVKVLDTFTQLEAEMEAEMEARRRQYQYYRDALLSFDDDATGDGAATGSVRWATLGDIGKVSMCKRVLKHETDSVGDIPFYKIGTFGGMPDAFISRELYHEYRRRYSFPKQGDILISAAGTIGRAIPYDGADAYFQDSNIVWIDNDESQVTNKYLWHWYQIVEWATDGGTIQRLYNENLRQTRIAIPPLEEQARIVAILDQFDALVNDLSSGLPAEIKARRQQYEYYRDRLLSFKEAA